MFKGLRCIRCSEEDCVSLDLDDCQTYRCRQCDEEFTAGDVTEHLASWQRVLDWAATASPVEA